MDQKQAIQALGALAQDHRLSVFRLLVRAGQSGMAAGDIARTIGIAPAALSFHLKELDHAGLIEATREGRFIRYAVNFEQMQSLLVFLTEDCCAGYPMATGSTDPDRSKDCAVSSLSDDLSCNTTRPPAMKSRKRPAAKKKRAKANA